MCRACGNVIATWAAHKAAHRAFVCIVVTVQRPRTGDPMVIREQFGEVVVLLRGKNSIGRAGEYTLDDVRWAMIFGCVKSYIVRAPSSVRE